VGESCGAVCLFCPAMYTEMNDLLTHMTSIHDFDFQHVRNSLKLSFYRQVKLINFIRRQVHLKKCIHCEEEFESKEELTEHMESLSHMKVPEDVGMWDHAEYFFPTYENDELLNRLDDDLYGKDEKVPVEPEDSAVVPGDSVLNDRSLIEAIMPNGTAHRGGGRGKGQRGGKK
jgi:hypothetical protein